MVDAARVFSSSSVEVQVKETLSAAELLSGVLAPLTNRLAQSSTFSIDPDTQIKIKYLSDQYRAGASGEEKITINTAERADHFEHFPPTPVSARRFNLRDVLALLLSIKPILEKATRQQTGAEWTELRQVLTSKLEMREYEARKEDLFELSRELTTIAQKLVNGPEKEVRAELGRLPSWLAEIAEDTTTEEEVVTGWDRGVSDVVQSALAAIATMTATSQTLEKIHLNQKGEDLEVGLAWEFLNEWLSQIYRHTYVLTPPGKADQTFATQPEPVTLKASDRPLLEFINDSLSRWIRNLRDSVRLAEELEKRGHAAGPSGSSSPGSTPAETPAVTPSTATPQTVQPSSQTVQNQQPTPSVNQGPGPVLTPPQNTRQLYDFYKANGTSYGRELAKYQTALLPLFLEVNGLNLGQAQFTLESLRQQYPTEYQDIQYWFSTAIEEQLVSILAKDPTRLSTPEGRLLIMTELQRSLMKQSLPQLSANIDRLKAAIPAAQSVAFNSDDTRLDQYLADHPVTDPNNEFLSKASFLTPADTGEFGQYLNQLGLSTTEQETLLKNLSVYIAAGEGSSRFLVLDQTQLQQVLGISLSSTLAEEDLDFFRMAVANFAQDYAQKASTRLGGKLGKQFSFTALTRPTRSASSKLDEALNPEEMKKLSVLAELSANLNPDSVLAGAVASEVELNRMGIVADLQMKALREAMVQEQTQAIVQAVNLMRQQNIEQAKIDDFINQQNIEQANALATKAGPRDLIDGYAAGADGRRIPTGGNIKAVSDGLKYIKNGIDAAAKLSDLALRGALAATGVGAAYSLIPESIRKYLSLGLMGAITAAIAKMLSSLSSLVGGAVGGVVGALGGAGVGFVVGSVPGAIIGGLIGGVGGMTAGAFIGVPEGIGITGPGITPSSGGFNLTGPLFGGGSGGGTPPPSPFTVRFAGVPFSAGTAITAVGVGALTVTAVMNQMTAFLPPLLGVGDAGEISRYLTATKTFTPYPTNGKFENSQLPQKVSYKITLAPKDEYQVEIISLTDSFSFEPNEKIRKDQKPPQLPTSPYSSLDKVIPEVPPDKVKDGKIILEPGDAIFYGGPGKYDATFGPEFNDSAVENKVIMKIKVTNKATGQTQQVAGAVPVQDPFAPDDPSKPIEDSVTASAVICFGDCPIAGPSDWPTSGTITQLPYNGGKSGSSHAKGGPFGPAGLDAFDISGNMGDPVYSPFAGQICGRPYMSNGYGNYLVLDKITGASYQLIFAHLNNTIFGNQQKCKDVKAGEFIGYKGTSGNSTGVHLHYGLAPAQGAESRVAKIVPEGTSKKVGDYVKTSYTGGPQQQ